MKTLALASASIMLALLSGCSDASRAQFGSIGNPAHVTCYSGGKVIYSGNSTGKVSTESQSDGWYFKDAATGKLIRVSGDCLIEN